MRVTSLDLNAEKVYGRTVYSVTIDNSFTCHIGQIQLYNHFVGEIIECYVDYNDIKRIASMLKVLVMLGHEVKTYG